MKLVGNTELKTRNLGDSLQFVLTRSFGWTEIAIGVILIGGLLSYAWRQSSTILAIFAVLGIFGMVINGTQGQEALLQVTESGIVARKKPASWFGKEVTIPVSEISSMGWSAGSDGDEGGVYVMCGYSQSWVLPGATEEHGRIVISAIEEQFPAFPVTDRTPASLLFGDDSGITTLHLSKHDKNIL